VYSKIFENYTLKQWGMRPEELSPSVTGRVPVRISRDDRYFQDTYQAMPKHGFTPMFERILAHPNITVELGCDFEDLSGVEYDRMVYTGPIDGFFNYVHGELPYRSLRFECEFAEREWLQPVGTINYPNDHAYTRITEFKHITGQQTNGTSTVREYPQAYIPGENDPYYPVPLPSRELYARYEAEAKKLGGKVLFAGRLGDYKYYNMDQAVGRALAIIQDIASGDASTLEIKGKSR
jgi:UDP-galactopyranose mutase